MQQLQLPQGLTTTFQGNAQAFQDSLTSVPLLILAALVCVYLILGVLYESFIHPLTILSTLPSAGLGALATLMLFGYEFSLVALIGTILLIGIVKKNGIMMVDFAISAEREEGLTPTEAIRKAALMRFRPIMMTTMAALLGGVPLDAEPRHRLGAAPAARLYDGRRPDRQSGADPVHDAGHLSLSRPAVALALRVQESQAARRRSATEPEPAWSARGSRRKRRSSEPRLAGDPRQAVRDPARSRTPAPARPLKHGHDWIARSSPHRSPKPNISMSPAQAVRTSPIVATPLMLSQARLSLFGPSVRELTRTMSVAPFGVRRPDSA